MRSIFSPSTGPAKGWRVVGIRHWGSAAEYDLVVIFTIPTNSLHILCPVLIMR